MLGFTTGTGLAFTQIRESAVSKTLGKIGDWFSEIFSGEAASSPQTPSAPLDPISLISPTFDKITEATKTVLGVVPESYTWIKQKDNSEFLMTFFKNFLNYSFLETVVFRFHLIFKAWSGIFTNSKELLKFPGAFNTLKSLAKFLSKTEQQSNGEKDMVNWLFVRLMVHPRSMIRVLYKVWRKAEKQSKQTVEEDQLKCNGQAESKKKKKEEKSWVACLIDKGGQKLTTEMTNFLKQGKSPKGAEKD